MCFRTINICFIISLVLVVHMSSIVKAQDQLILHTAEEIKVKIFEIGTDEISYKLEENLEGPVYKVSKSDVFLIIFQNGTTWKPQQVNAASMKKPSGFSEMRKKNKSRYLIGDTLQHHIVMFHAGAPDLAFPFGTVVAFHASLSYELQILNNLFGIRIMPQYAYELEARGYTANGILSVAVSPRVYLKNWKSSQFYVGLEGLAGSYIIPKEKQSFNSTYRTIVTSGSFVFGGQVTQKNNFNLNIETGLGYKYSGYWYDYPDDMNVSSDGFLIGGSMFQVFVRFGIGGRIRGKKK